MPLTTEPVYDNQQAKTKISLGSVVCYCVQGRTIL